MIIELMDNRAPVDVSSVVTFCNVHISALYKCIYSILTWVVSEEAA